MYLNKEYIEKKKLSSSKLVIVIFILMVVLSAAVSKIFNSSSMALGVIITFSFIYILYIINPRKIYFSRNFLSIITILLIITYVISIFSMLQNPTFEIYRFLGTYILIVLLVFTSFVFQSYIKDVNNKLFHSVINFVFYTFSFDLIFGIINKILYDNVNTFLFKEPSHLSLIFLPFFLYKLLINTKLNKSSFFLVICIIYFAYLIQNLTLLVGIIIAMCIVNRFKTTLYIFLLLLISFPFLNLDYFISRLVLSLDSDNLSVLVFLSGWERVFINIENSFGLGIGLNQLGYINNQGVLQDKIFTLSMSNLNLYDGGSTAAKVISELGLLGLFLLLTYLFFVIRFLVVLKTNLYYFDSKDIFFFSIFIMFSMELFIRGAGFFTPGSILFIISILYINSVSLHKIRKFNESK